MRWTVRATTNSITDPPRAGRANKRKATFEMATSAKTKETPESELVPDLGFFLWS